MSYDGSSAKSYIRHTTEKERLDNLAFASFPEDYLPYAAAPGHHRVAAPPPYLLWGDDRRRRPTTKRRKPKCAGALLCAIALVVVAILAVVAISVYLGVVTNLFRSPVVSVSGRFTASEDFSEELLNSSSSKFLEKADVYQAKVEKAFLSSSLEPAFIAARIYSFRPGLVVFFRVYLDRRKIQEEGESPPTELVRELVTQKLTADPESVHVEENEELLSVELRPSETVRPPLLTTPKPTIENGHQRPPQSGGVGEWRPVPIEDSVSPSFDRPPGAVGSVRSPEEIPRRNPAEGFGSVRVLEETPPRNQQLPPTNTREGVGSVRVLEESPARNPQLSGNTREGGGSVRLLEENSPRNPLLSVLHRQSTGSVGVSGEPSVKNPPLPAIQKEGIGSVRLLDESTPKTPLQQGVGSIRVLDDNSQSPSKVSENQRDGVGSVRLIDETPKRNPQIPAESRAGVGLVRVLEDTPPRKLSTYGNPSEGQGFVHPMEEPPTLAPSVSLVVRNRSRSDRPKNLPTRLAKIQQNGDLVKNQNVGMGSIREIITEEGFPLPLQREPPIIASRLLDLGPTRTTTISSVDQNETEIKSIEENTETTEIESRENVAEISLTTENNKELIINNKTEDLNLYSHASFESENASDENIISTSAVTSTTFMQNETSFDEVTTKQIQTQELKISPLENILFSHTQSTVTTTVTVNEDDNFTIETSTKSLPLDSSVTKEEKGNEFSQNIDSIIVANTSHEKEEIFEKENATSVTENSDEDIHSSIVNYSQYLYSEPHYHTIENERNVSSKESFEAHTLEGHGFHKPSVTSDSVSLLKASSVDSTTQIPITSTLNSSTKNQDSEHKSSEVLEIISSQTHSVNTSGTTAETSTELSVGSSETFDNTSNDYETWSEEDEAGNVTTDDISQQAKVVPQLQADLISNDIEEEEESSDEDNGRFEDEILRHITTLRPQPSRSDISQLCPPGSVPCDANGEKCGVRCDLRKDCLNNEDEEGCTCSDLLRAMGQSQKICDGVDDCSDGSDEEKCPWCPSSDYFRCPGSRTCVTLDRVCDGKDDCPGAQDERRCVSLADSSMEAESYEYRSEGYLIVRRSGLWGKLCLDALNQSSDLDRRIRDLGKAVCSTLTYKNMSSSIRTNDETESEDSYYQISTEPANNRSSTASSLFEPTSCERKEVLKVQCKSLECGLRPFASQSQRRRIVGGRSADGAGAWPWAAALYREGEFQCGAALISDIWLVSAAHCFYSSQNAYWTARLGVLRRGSELASGGEQVRRIQAIILHPQYEDVGFINDIALLRMDRAVPFSDSLRPICLPESPKEDATLWHGHRCSVVGWGKLYEIGHTFPDSLQEVRLPVISSAECQRRSIFLPAYRITPNMFCAGYDRGGRDACLGDSGGPMACQRHSDGRWILLGVTSNGDGCGRPGRPGVYSQVAGFLSWIQETISELKVFNGKTGSESTCSGGVRCRLGRCIQRARVCDGRRDCAGGEDEDSC